MFVECILWFGDPSVEPNLGFGQIDIIIPDDTVAVGIGVGALENGIVPEGLEDVVPKEWGAVVHSSVTIVERDQQSLARPRLDISDLGECRGCCHILLQTREILVVLRLPHLLEFVLVLFCPVTHEALCSCRDVSLQRQP
jgi:hypothetical protein